MVSLMVCSCLGQVDRNPRTSYSANSATSAIVINNGGITFDSATHREIATEACIRDFLVLKDSDSHFNSFNGTCTVVQEGHGGLGSTRRVSEDCF